MRYLLVAALLVGCKKPEETEPAEVITGIENEPGGNPIVPDVAMMPFPSDLYLQADDASRTGKSLVFTEEALPSDLVPETFAGIDGWSRAPVILTYFRDGVDRDSLPDPADVGASLEDDAPIFLVHGETHERIPLLAEVDATATYEYQETLILRPHRALDPETTYVVLIRDSLLSREGEPLQTSKAFRALRDGIATDDDTVESMRDDYDVVNGAIAGNDLDPSEVIQGWSFTTRSREQVVTPLLSMADVMMDFDLDDVVIDSDEVIGSNRLVRGTMTFPNFIDADGEIQVDADDIAIQQGTRTEPFLLTIPTSVTSTRPTVLFGHGFFSHRDEATRGSFNAMLRDYEFPAVSINFLGFNGDDQVDTFGLLADFNQTTKISAMQMQSEAQFVALERYTREKLAPAYSEIDGDDLTYMGTSNGGTQGFNIMTIAPNLERGVLVVPGGALTHMLQRASQWTLLGTLIENRFDDSRDLQLGAALLQLNLDPWDSINFVDHLVLDRFEGRKKVPKIVLHEAVEDAQVNNMITHWLAAEMGAPVFTPNTLDPWGLETIPAKDYDGDAALYIYDEGYPPLPADNTPPQENGAHGSVRSLDVYQEHVATFIEDHEIVYVCSEACDPN